MDKRLVVFFLTMQWFTVVPAQVQRVSEVPESSKAAALQRLQQQARYRWVVRWSADNKRVRSIIGMESYSGKQKGQERARAFLRNNAVLFDISSGLQDLKVIGERESSTGQHIQFQQQYRDVPVENGRIKVNLNAQGAVLSVFSSYATIKYIKMEPAINAQQVRDIAIEAMLQEAVKPRSPRDGAEAKPLTRDQLKLKEEPSINQVVFLIDNGASAVLAYKVVVKAEPHLMVEFIIDAQTGKILRANNLIRYAVDGEGRVFIPNPINALNDGTLRDTGDNAADVPNGAYTDVPLWDLNDPVGGQHSLTGLYVKSEDIQNPNTATVTEAGTAFNYDRSQDGFEEVMVYYHIDRSQRYIQSLGFIDANNRQIRVDAHGRTDDNASYDPTPSGAGFLVFGDGGSEGGEDADMIIHEYGHSIQDNQNPDAFPPAGEAGAIGEGFGDYFASSSYLAESTASGWDPACYDEWDWINFSGNTAGTACERQMDNTKVYPADVAGEEHEDGELWSGALWDALLQLGKTTADRLALQSNYNMPVGPTFKQGADAVMTADLQLFFGSHLTQLCQIFINRGFYAAADCPQLPPDAGNQDTLVVLVNFNDAALANDPINFAAVQGIIGDMNDYLAEVTYGQVSLTPTIKGWYNLPSNRATYYDDTAANVLIEMVDDAIAEIVSAEPGFDFSTYDRMLLISNDDGSGGEDRGQRDWATTGPWPYTVPGAFGNKLMSVSVHRFDHSEAQFTHALGHHFGLFDLYSHEGVIFPRPYANGWGNMAKDDTDNFNNVHYLGWSKLKPDWLDDADVRFVARPPATPDPADHFDQTFPLSRQSIDAAGQELIQIGTTQGVTDRDEERVSYYVEARDKSGAYDVNLPDSGVLVYYVNEDISQGFGPLRLVDATPADNDVSNAALQIGDSINNIDSTGLNVSVLAPTGGEDYRVRIDYDPPESDVDAWIHARDGNWRSVDIWVDSPACNEGVCGFDLDNGRSEVDRGDKPAPEQPNRLYAHVYNHGPGIAHNVRIDFWISDPYHGIDGGGVDPDTGGNVAFNKHFFTVIDDLPPSDEGVVVFVAWTPEPVPPGQSNPHACVKVKIAEVFNDTNDFNQASQENIHEYDTTASSPYKEVVQPFQIANPYDHPILVYLRADNVPQGWDATLIPEKVHLPVGGSTLAQVQIQAPQDYPVCSTEYVSVSAWYPSGDTLLQLGGTTAQVNLKKSASVNIQNSWENCPRKNPKQAVASHVQSSNLLLQDETRCKLLHSEGCTDPPQPYAHITLEYTGPNGEPIYHDVVTDANGCYEDFLVNPVPGGWTVEATYPGDECFSADTTGDISVTVPPDSGASTCIPCWLLWLLLIGLFLLILWLYWRCCRRYQLMSTNVTDGGR